MIKIVVSNKIYLKLPENLVENITSRFTFNIYSHPQQKYPKIVRQIFKISDEVYQLERGCLDYILDLFHDNNIEYTIIDRTVSKPVEFPALLLPPREDQDTICKSFKESALLNGQPGWGKSFAAIYIATLLGQKTLVVCTTTAIRDNWIKEVKQFLGIDAGIIGSGKFNIDAPIVIGNFQTVMKKSQELSKEFGFLVVDEMHHSPADSFTAIISASHAKYRLGLSGTLKRKDGLECCFYGLFGSTVFKPEQNNVIDPTIYRLHTDIEFSSNQMIPWANRVNKLYETPEYKILIAQLIAMLEAAGYVTLITSDRIDFIVDLHNAVTDDSSRLFIGEIDTETRNQSLAEVKAKKVNKIFSSTQLFSEGISQNDLSALIHTGSTNNESMIYQLIGRIQRITPDKRDPIVIDIIFKGQVGKKHAKERKSYYLVKNWKVVDTHSLDELAYNILNIPLQDRRE